jgi:histidine kinase/DNA gyrase B/HSP90-like ATPase
LRASLSAAREKVIPLLSLIPRDISGLTVHDISHIDALWGAASDIIGHGFPLNPLEGYILGVAFLLHDAGMTIGSFPEGIEGLKKTDEWKDAVASRRAPTSVQDERELIAVALRNRHARQAEILATTKWPSRDGGDSFIIEDEDLREYYGIVIGKIAHSHHWDVERLKIDLPGKLGSMGGFPADWTVDPLKIAGILRVADASHISAERAPRFHRTLVRPTGVSDDHWNFQGRLFQPYCEGDTLVFTSKSFRVNDAAAWWLAYNAIGLISKELRQINELFEDTDTADTPRGAFRIRRVKGAESPESLAKLLPTEGWWPVDTSVRVTDPLSLVQMLGGRQLYGDRPQVVLRELLQNSVDAVEARRRVDPNWSPETGKILIKLFEREERWVLQVFDNGVGMSRRTLVGSLLDFGKSFWTSSMVQEEFPGLRSSSFSPVGKFGVGFFSTFMLANRVRVASRRFDQTVEPAWNLTFTDGLRVPAILAQGTDKEGLQGWSTCVELTLPWEKIKSLRIGESIETSIADQGFSKSFLAQTVVHVAPATSVEITIEEPQSTCTLKKDFWIDCSDAAFGLLLECDIDENWGTLQAYLNLDRSRQDRGRERTYSLMRETRGSIQNVVGRAAIFPPDGRRRGHHIVRGFRGESISWCTGFVPADTHLASRLETTLVLSREAAKAWANEQIARLSETEYAVEDFMSFAHVLYSRVFQFIRQDLDISRLPLIATNRGVLSLKRFIEILRRERLCLVPSENIGPRSSDRPSWNNVLILPKLLFSVSEKSDASKRVVPRYEMLEADTVQLLDAVDGISRPSGMNMAKVLQNWSVRRELSIYDVEMRASKHPALRLLRDGARMGAALVAYNAEIIPKSLKQLPGGAESDQSSFHGHRNDVEAVTVIVGNAIKEGLGGHLDRVQIRPVIIVQILEDMQLGEAHPAAALIHMQAED